MMMYNYCYEYSLLSYLEYPILLVQQYIMIALVLKYKRMYNQNTYICVGAYFATVLLFGYHLLPSFLLAMLVVGASECCHSLRSSYSIPISASLHSDKRFQQDNPAD